MSYEHVVDLDADSFIPDGWKVVEHRKAGIIKFDPARIKLHLSSHQQGGKRIGGNKLRKELKFKPILNANMLDFCLKNPHLIPEGWKKKAVCFWGTIYKFVDGGFLAIRFLVFDGRDEWHWGWCHLVGGWGGDKPAALLVS